MELIAPRAGDPADHLVVVRADGQQLALTNTCAANALGITQPGDYAHARRRRGGRGVRPGRRRAAASGATRWPAGCWRRPAWPWPSSSTAVMADHHLQRPTIVAVGGGAGGLGRHVATLLGLECVVPPEAEVISSVGDALSLLRAERERTVSAIDPADLRQLAREVETELLAAGASPGSIEVRVDEEPEKGTIRAVATGAVGLRTGARPGREAEDDAGLARAAAEAGYGSPERAGEFWLARRDPGSHQRVLVLDRFGDPVAEVAGEVVTDPGRPGGRGRPPDPPPRAHHPPPHDLGDRRGPPDRADLGRRRRDRAGLRRHRGGHGRRPHPLTGARAWPSTSLPPAAGDAPSWSVPSRSSSACSSAG